MKRVKFFTNLEHEFIQNYKYAQIAFTKLGVEKVTESKRWKNCMLVYVR